MTSEFEPPPKKWSILAVVGGVVTAATAIAFLSNISDYWSRTASAPKTVSTSTSPQSPIQDDPLAQSDAQSMELPGERVLATTSSRPLAPKALTPTEQAMAQQAWQYFEANWNESGLVNSADGFASVTLWDQSAAIAALVAAKELDIIPESEFNTKMRQTLTTLAALPLYRGELPNKVYNAQTLVPVDYGQLETEAEIGWSAIDLGRMALWLKIVGNRYPEFSKLTQAVWDSWQVERLTKAGQMYGTSSKSGTENYYQEGRLG